MREAPSTDSAPGRAVLDFGLSPQSVRCETNTLIASHLRSSACLFLPSCPSRSLPSTKIDQCVRNHDRLAFRAWRDLCNNNSEPLSRRVRRIYCWNTRPCINSCLQIFPSLVLPSILRKTFLYIQIKRSSGDLLHRTVHLLICRCIDTRLFILQSIRSCGHAWICLSRHRALHLGKKSQCLCRVFCLREFPRNIRHLWSTKSFLDEGYYCLRPFGHSRCSCCIFLLTARTACWSSVPRRLIKKRWIFGLELRKELRTRVCWDEPRGFLYQYCLFILIRAIEIRYVLLVLALRFYHSFVMNFNACSWP